MPSRRPKNDVTSSGPKWRKIIMLGRSIVPNNNENFCLKRQWSWGGREKEWYRWNTVFVNASSISRAVGWMIWSRNVFRPYFKRHLNVRCHRRTQRWYIVHQIEIWSESRDNRSYQKIKWDILWITVFTTSTIVRNIYGDKFGTSHMVFTTGPLIKHSISAMYYDYTQYWYSNFGRQRVLVKRLLTIWMPSRETRIWTTRTVFTTWTTTRQLQYVNNEYGFNRIPVLGEKFLPWNEGRTYVRWCRRVKRSKYDSINPCVKSISTSWYLKTEFQLPNNLLEQELYSSLFERRSMARLDKVFSVRTAELGGTISLCTRFIERP